MDVTTEHPANTPPAASPAPTLSVTNVVPSPALGAGSMLIGEFVLDLNRVMGRGTWSTVYFARHLHTGEPAAVKLVPKAKLKPHESRFVHVEAEMLSRLQHPNVVRMYKMLEDANNYYLILEYVPGVDLYSYLERYKRLSERHAKRLFAQIVDALCAIHEQGILHRDIKLENIILSPPLVDGNEESRRVTLLDFGLAGRLYTADQRLSEWCGSPLYASVELINKQPYRHEVDIWALGVVLFCMVAGYQPFHGPTVADIFQRIRYQKLAFPDGFSQPLRDLISRMLTRDAAARIAVTDIRRHVWLRRHAEQTNIRIRENLPPAMASNPSNVLRASA